MDWELIFWCVLGAFALFSLIGALFVEEEPTISRETIARIENGGRHL